MAAREIKGLERIATALAVDLEPAADGVVVEQEGVRNLLTAPAAIQQQDGVGLACHATFLKAIPRDARQPSPVVLAEKLRSIIDRQSNRDHPGRQPQRILADSGYIVHPTPDGSGGLLGPVLAGVNHRMELAPVRFPERVVPGAQDLNTALDVHDLDVDSRFSDQLPEDLKDVRYRLHDLHLLDAGITAPITIHSRLNAGDIRLNRSVDRYSTEKHLVGEGLPRYWFGLVNVGAVQVSQGAHTAVSSGTIGSALRSRPGTMGLSSDNSVRTNLSIEADALEHTLSAMLDDRLEDQIEFHPVVDWGEGLARSVVGLMDCLVADAKRPNGLVTNDIALASFSDVLLRTVLLGLQHNHSERLSSPGCAALPVAVRRAEDFMRVHADRPVRMAEVAVAAGCSLRTLEASFERARTMTPLAAFRSIRLERVREDLRRGEGEQIGAIARRYGFTNAGRLATAYRERFGELPSDTAALRPKRSDRRARGR